MEKELGGGGKRVVGGMVEKGEILEERERESEGKEQPSWKFYRRRPAPVSRLWMPCHPVISPYQPRNYLETSTGLSDDAELLRAFVLRIIRSRGRIVPRFEGDRG